MKLAELRESIRTYRNINETIKTMREKLDTLLAFANYRRRTGRGPRKKGLRAVDRKARLLVGGARGIRCSACAVYRRDRQTGCAKAELDFLDEELRGSTPRF